MATLSDLNLESKYPEFACIQCLFKAGGRPIKLIMDQYVRGPCPVCGKRGDLVSPEFFGYPVLKIKNKAIEHEEL